MAKMKRIGKGNKNGFPKEGFEIGRGGKEWFPASRETDAGFCRADISPKKGAKKKSDKDGY